MDQGFHLSPDFGITLNFDVRLHEETVVPGVLLAIDRSRFIVEAEISDDVRACRIGSADPGLAVHEAIRLIEIYRLRYVCGNDLIILARLGDAIHLNCEQHRNAIPLKFSRQRNGLGSTPAMSVKDDAGILLFFGG